MMAARSLAATSLAAALAAGCGVNQTPAPTGSPPPPLACVPDLDGVLTAAEVPVALGVPVDFFVSRDVAVDVAGTDAGGARRWDWSAERQDDTVDEVEATPLADHWFASSFAGGHFVTPGPGGLDAVYAADDAGLYLLGLASPEPDPPGGRTLIVYDAPVAVLRLPLVDGATWTEVGTVTGATVNGLPYNGTDTYQLAADARGELHVPYLRFTDALRVRTLVTAQPAIGAATTRRQVSFFAECMGEVGRAVSRPDEPAADFTSAAEVRRFAL